MTNEVAAHGRAMPRGVLSKAVRKTGLELAEPPISYGLKGILEEFIPSTGEYFVTRSADKTEAAIVARGLAELCAPATSADVQEWLDPLSDGVRNPPTPEEFATRVVAIGRALGDLPVGVWTAETQARAMRTFKYWPSVADLDEMLRPVGESLRRRLRNAQRVAEGTLMQPARPVSPEQERAYIHEIAEARRHHRDAARHGDAAHSVAEPVEMPSREELIAKYENIAATSMSPALVQQAQDILVRLRAPTSALTAAAELQALSERRSGGPRLSAASLVGAKYPEVAGQQAATDA